MSPEIQARKTVIREFILKRGPGVCSDSPISMSL